MNDMTQAEAVEIFPGYIARNGLGTVPHEILATMSGLDFLQRLASGEFPAPHIAATMNFGLTEVSEGRAVFTGVPGVQHLNPLGGVHGGWAATLLDSALGCAVHTMLQPGEGYTTIEFKVNCTRPITPRSGELIAEGRVVHKGKTIAVSEATLKDANGKLLAMGTETCAIFPLGNLAPR